MTAAPTLGTSAPSMPRVGRVNAKVVKTSLERYIEHSSFIAWCIIRISHINAVNCSWINP